MQNININFRLPMSVIPFVSAISYISAL